MFLSLCTRIDARVLPGDMLTIVRTGTFAIAQ